MFLRARTCRRDWQPSAAFKVAHPRTSIHSRASIVLARQRASLRISIDEQRGFVGGQWGAGKGPFANKFTVLSPSVPARGAKCSPVSHETPSTRNTRPDLRLPHPKMTLTTRAWGQGFDPFWHSVGTQ